MNRVSLFKVATRAYYPRSMRPFLPVFLFCEEKFEGEGTEYSNWVLARSASHNHNIEYMKRKYAKDRYSIHRLTNIHFMC